MGVTNKERGVTLHEGGTIRSRLSGVRTPTVNDTLVIGDASGAVEMNSASARTITIPPDVFPLFTVITLTRLGAGTVQMVAGSGVTLRSKDDDKFISTQYTGATIYQRALNEWVIFGDLSVS